MRKFLTGLRLWKNKLIVALLLLCGPAGVLAQQTWPVNGPVDERSGLHAFVNATIIPSPGELYEGATMLIRDGVVEALGRKVKIPADAVIHDMSGLYIYPAFIDIYTQYGISPLDRKSKANSGEVYLSNTKGAYSWNEAMMPEFRAHQAFHTDTTAATELRKLGFGAVMSHRMDGIARGSGTFVLLANGRENELILREKAAALYSFSKGSSRQDYPSSLMGIIALMRQTYLDADWYKKQTDEVNLSLKAWNSLQDLPQILDARDQLSVLRADRLGNEFGVKYIIKENGNAYRRADEIAASGASLIVPLNFPAPYDVHDPFDARQLSLNAMRHWEMAPANAAILKNAGIRFALTTNGIVNKSDFMGNLRKAILYGLDEQTALAALTTVPAEMLHMSDRIGQLRTGMIANFQVRSAPVFEPSSTLYQLWIKSEHYDFVDPAVPDFRGVYELSLSDGLQLELTIGGERHNPEFSLNKQGESPEKTADAKGHIGRKSFSLSFAVDGQRYLLSGWTENAVTLKGSAQNAGGQWLDWTARKTGEFTPKAAEEKKDRPALEPIPRPFSPYGWTLQPKAASVLFKNATVWTNGPDGILEHTDVLTGGGKIVAVGKDLTSKNAEVVDATGMHLSCGIVDEHSHIAISRGVNEGTQASSAEVRIGDVVNSEDINIYRQLAGGVTTSQLLHGSANPIGGQSAIIKLRWRLSPEQMKFENSDGFIKFALGENVKQSNWGDNHRSRFPQTRMGVEQVYMDHFTRAREYEARKNAGDTTLRRDLELEALLEVLNGERFVTCHSYVQSEINMLMKVAERFGFHINTFTHILEGYKVADKMKAHGAGASTFSDWWAYKYEVIDAIPYNAAILNEMGIVTAINSDDAEMGRRLNQEAAKTMKYGGVSQEDAWKMVTLNPAKLLHIDDRVGSVEVGKDADLVLWTDNPLSVYARVQQTYVDGVPYFDALADKKMQMEIREQRQKLIGELLNSTDGEAKTQQVKPEGEKQYHCDTFTDEGR